MALRGDHPDYIHAVYINVRNYKCWVNVAVMLILLYIQGYKQQRAFIIAQSPMQSTVRDFWKMVYDRKCGVIVMLSDLVEEGKVWSSRLAVLLSVQI